MKDLHKTFFYKRELFEKMYNRYKDKIDFYFKLAEKNVVKKEYSRGGECIHRGFYCPSPLLDTIVGNCNRGKLLQRINKMPDYEYWFNSDNKLILVKKANDFGNRVLYNIELIYYYPNSTESMIYSNKDNMIYIDQLTRCTYEDNKIQSYDHALLGENPFCCYEIVTENFEYDNNVLVSSTLEQCNFDVNILSKDTYLYKYDTNENLLLDTWKIEYNE